MLIVLTSNNQCWAVSMIGAYMYYDAYHDTKKVSSIKYHDTFLVEYQYQYH